jgi:hypothetical protein
LPIGQPPSWCINRRVDGGLERPLKVVQARLGHASIQMTADRYGHLFSHCLVLLFSSPRAASWHRRKHHARLATPPAPL